LVRFNFPLAEVVAVGDPLPEFDFHCPMMSLPMMFGTELSNIPHLSKYFSTDSKHVALFDKYLNSNGKLKIGVVARGSPTFKNDKNRSMNLETMISALSGNNTYVVLHKDLSRSDLECIESYENVVTAGEHFGDFYDTAAFCANLDVVISVDTSVAHLAASCGLKTCVLLPYRADWRWGASGETTPWYDTVHLFRQSRYQDWSSVLKAVNEYLKGL
jgi:ADP-heptose:LPS heptosyltransferase